METLQSLLNRASLSGQFSFLIMDSDGDSIATEFLPDEECAEIWDDEEAGHSMMAIEISAESFERMRVAVAEHRRMPKPYQIGLN